MTKLVEIYSTDSFSRTAMRGDSPAETFSLREVYINPEHVVCLREDSVTKEKVKHSNLSEELDTRQEFTKLIIDRGQSGMDLIVVGGVSVIQAKLNNGETKHVLKG